jgi:hypothetical protein
MANTNPPIRRGSWQQATPQQPTIAVVQPTGTASTASQGAGTGAAPATVAAMNGTLYIRRDGTHGAVTLLYINTSGANTIGTTWTAID